MVSCFGQAGGKESTQKATAKFKSKSESFAAKVHTARIYWNKSKNLQQRWHPDQPLLTSDESYLIRTSTNVRNFSVRDSRGPKWLRQFMCTWDFLVLSGGKPSMPTKTILGSGGVIWHFRGGGIFGILGGAGGEWKCQFYFYGRRDFSDLRICLHFSSKHPLDTAAADGMVGSCTFHCKRWRTACEQVVGEPDGRRLHRKEKAITAICN